jgi:hypothetical protein
LEDWTGSGHKPGASRKATIEAEDDFFALAEEGTTFVLLPRLGIGLGTTHTVFADGSYVTDWMPRAA